MESIGPVKLRTEIEQWPLVTPFRIAGYMFEAVDVLVVTLEKDGHQGRGEAAGVYYRNDKPSTMQAQVEAVRARLAAGTSIQGVQDQLPAGGARNALDCALWDLRAKLERRPVWQMLGLQQPRPVLTTFTCGAGDPKEMASRALSYVNAKAIKLKLTGDPIDADRVRAVRDSLPDVWLAVDANQGFNRAFLEQLLPVLVQSNVALIEQPFPIGQEQLLDGLDSPIPIAADESVQTRAEIPQLAGRVDIINIKLDKCGGLTEGLAMVQLAHDLGLDAMVGNMMGTSLAMAPAFLVGQMCKVVDLDGPVYLTADRSVTVEYRDGLIACPSVLWG